MAASRASLSCFSLVLAALGCGPVGGVEPGGGTNPITDQPRPTPPATSTDVAAPTGMNPAAQATREDGGASCPIAAPLGYAALTPNEKLPDPFLSMDGTRITRVEQWRCRRAEISAQVQEYELGPKPPRPSSVSGSFANGTLSVSAGEGDRSISFDANITLPGAGTAPYPAMIAIGGSSLDNAALAAAGVALINFPNGELGVQMNGGSRGQGKFYELYGAGHAAGAMMAWAWGVSRLIDALEMTPDAQIDPERLGVTGCSRNGKGALVVGAFDERIALTIPQESGAGGSSLWRVADVSHADWIAAGMPANLDIQTLGQIVQENVWFRASFSQFAQTATRLPFDQHMVMALVAPRALFVVNNTSQYWLGREGSFYGQLTARPVWEALGIPQTMGASQVGGHAHCQNVPAFQTAEIMSYVQKFLIGDGPDVADVMYTDGGFTLDRERWVDWETPALAPGGM